jgi:flagellar biosynthesis protein FliR
MIPVAYADLQTQLLIWFVAMLRPGAALLAAPVFGTTVVPLQVRIILSLAIGIPAAATVSIVLPTSGLVSVPGVMMIAGEVVLGLAFGFALQIGFAAALVAGDAIGNAMGLGFAAMQDPVSGHSSTAIGQFLNMLGTVLFLATGGHLALIELVVTSFRTLPPGAALPTAAALRGLVDFGGLMFAAGLSVALPVGFALVLVQIVMATITRSAPALNLLAIGIPATVLAGVVLLVLATPAMAAALEHAMRLALEQAQHLASV